MPNGAWSNDQLNAIFIYAALTGQLILSVDETGFYFSNSNNGSYVKLQTNAGSAENSTAVRLQPPDSANPAVIYTYPGDIFSTEYVGGDNRTHGELRLLSPQIGTLLSAYFTMGGQSIEGAAINEDDSSLTLGGGFLYGNNGGDISQGAVDFVPFVYTSTIGGSEAAFDWTGGPNAWGVMVAQRCYTARFVGTMRSTSAGDRVRCRIYSNNVSNTIVGGTLLGDTGTTTIAAAGVDQPWSAEWSFNGLPGKFILLATQRVSGGGTPSLTVNVRSLVDVFPANAYA